MKCCDCVVIITDSAANDNNVLHNVCCPAGGVPAATARALQRGYQLVCRGRHHYGVAQERASEQSEPPPVPTRCVTVSLGHCVTVCLGVGVLPSSTSAGASFFPVAGVPATAQRPDFKKLMGQAMGFMKFKKDAALQQGAQVLSCFDDLLSSPCQGIPACAGTPQAPGVVIPGCSFGAP